MGVKGLSKFINQSGYFENIDINYINNKKIAIDTSIFLYRYKYNTEGYQFIYRFIMQIFLFKKHNIIPIYVFDGEFPIEKQNTINERKELKERYTKMLENEIDENKKKNISKNIINITYEDNIILKELFTICGINYIESNTEGEKYCAYLNKIGEVDAVLSNDYDTLLFGANTLITFNNNKYYLYSLENILDELKITRESLIEMCIASGTDYYSKGICKIGIKKALKNVQKYGKIEDWVNIDMPCDLDCDKIKSIFIDEPEKNHDLKDKIDYILVKNKRKFNEYLERININIKVEIIEKLSSF